MSPPAQQGALSAQQLSAQQPPDPLTQLTNDIRLWKMATLVLGTGVVYLAASAWWRGRTAHKLLKELEGAKSESAKRAAAIAAAKHALG